MSYVSCCTFHVVPFTLDLSCCMESMKVEVDGGKVKYTRCGQWTFGSASEPHLLLA